VFNYVVLLLLLLFVYFYFGPLGWVQVQSVSWNPVEMPVLLSGSFDHSAAVFDTRRPEDVARWSQSNPSRALKHTHSLFLSLSLSLSLS
jgi:hypothetical protein